MKIIFITLLCLLLASGAFAQVGDKAPESQTVGIEEVYLAKDNGEGKAGEAVESFLTTDVPIYCIVELDSMKPATVKMNLVAVSVKGVKAESQVITVTFKTDGSQNRVSFKGKPEGDWVAGSYRIDIFIDGKLTRGKPFDIKKSPSQIQKTEAQVDSFAPPKPKTVRQKRKN
ncbi:MAG TPA: hypothetical protein VGC97_10615 [Pyrinomonadaceae bacterium]